MIGGIPDPPRKPAFVPETGITGTARAHSGPINAESYRITPANNPVLPKTSHVLSQCEIYTPGHPGPCPGRPAGVASRHDGRTGNHALRLLQEMRDESRQFREEVREGFGQVRDKLDSIQSAAVGMSYLRTTKISGVKLLALRIVSR